MPTLDDPVDREQFRAIASALAMQSMIATNVHGGPKPVAVAAIKHADALIAELTKK